MQALFLQHSRCFCSTSARSAAAKAAERVACALGPWRTALDATLTGHSQAKEALLLALLAREHAYIEGPPGCGKTALCQAAAIASGSTPVAISSLHRDIQISDLTGGSVITREKITPGGAQELIRQLPCAKKGFFSARVCVLDDLSRAPAEALAVMLGILGDRRLFGETLQLDSVLATGCPSDPEYRIDPLDASLLDRFALQVRMDGLLAGSAVGDWQQEGSGSLMGHLGRISARSGHSTTLELQRRLGLTKSDSFVMSTAHELLSSVALEEAKSLLLEAAAALVMACDAVGAPAPSDRALLIQAPRVLRARALLHGRAYCLPEDIMALELMTTFRVPTAVSSQVHSLLEKLLIRHRQRQTQKHKIAIPGDLSHLQQGTWQQGAAPGRRGRREIEVVQTVEAPDVQHAEPQSLPMKLVMKFLKWWASCVDAPTVNLHVDSISNMESMIEALRGELQQIRIDDAPESGGVPRGWHRLRRLELSDVDAADAVLWCENTTPELPRAQLRRRPRRGGVLAIVRDVSSSMAGLHAKWGSSLALKLVEVAEKSKMQLGYAEFHHDAQLHRSQDDVQCFLTQDYSRVRHLASMLECDGLTNYQKVLTSVLSEFETLGRGGSKAGNRHMLFLTDGHPTRGCKSCAAEARLAAALGVRIHAVFIGDGDYPEVLSHLAAISGGQQYQAVPNYETGRVTIWNQRT